MIPQKLKTYNLPHRRRHNLRHLRRQQLPSIQP
jgi:hypothetical protein